MRCSPARIAPCVPFPHILLTNHHTSLSRFAWDTVLPLFVKATFHWDSTAAGLIFFCIFIPGILSPAVGSLSDRYGAKWPSLAGFLLSVPLLICLRFVTEDTIGHKVLLGALLALLGVSLVFANTPLMSEISYAIADMEAKEPGFFGQQSVYGLGYGMFCTSFSLGGTIGTLMSGYVMAGRGWGTFTWAMAVWMAGGAIAVGLWLGEKPVPRKSETTDEESPSVARGKDPQQGNESRSGSSGLEGGGSAKALTT